MEDLEDTVRAFTSDMERDVDTLTRDVTNKLNNATRRAVAVALVVLFGAFCTLGILLGARASWYYYAVLGAVAVPLYAAIIWSFRQYCAKLRKQHSDGCVELQKRHSHGCAKILEQHRASLGVVEGATGEAPN